MAQVYDEDFWGNPIPRSKADTRELKRQARAAEQPLHDAYEAGLEEGRSQAGPSSSRPSRGIVKRVGDAGTIAGLMAFGTGFALVGYEIKVAKGQPTTSVPGQVSGGIGGGVRIIIGGFIGGGLLMFLSQAGDVGREFAVGLATIFALSALLIEGGAVWTAVAGLFGQPILPAATKPTSPTGTLSQPVPTTPTGSTAPTRA